MATEWQKAVLSQLLDKYENSKTYTGKNQVNQSFAVFPDRIFLEYSSDFADIEQIRRFEDEMNVLAQRGLIQLLWKNNEIKKIVANPMEWPRYYEILGRKDKNTQILEQISLYRYFLSKHETLRLFCEEEIEKLENGKKAKYHAQEAQILLELCLTILENKQDLLERELSISFFGDSKQFEQKYRKRVCGLLQKYGNYEGLLQGIDDKREIEQILLGEHHIFANPSYIYLKGDAILRFDDGDKIEIKSGLPLALSSQALTKMRSIQIKNTAVMTVENLTSFHRLEFLQYFYIFLSGYHNSLKQQLLLKIAQDNPEIKWYHFGDLDPDGFYIVEHLRRGTEIPFETWHMQVEDLVQYKQYGRELTEKDRVKLRNLLHAGYDREVLKYMLDQGYKVEQEIISWSLSRRK